MIELISVTIALLAGAFAGFYIERYSRTPPRLYRLGTRTTYQLESAASFDLPGDIPDLILTLPALEVLKIYLNSRGNRTLANNARIDNASGDCDILLRWVERDHQHIKRLAWSCLTDRVAARLNAKRKPLSAKNLLWFYADEQALLNHFASYCCPTDGGIILQRI